MAKLPFLVEPRNKPRVEVLGTDDSGKIEIERKGYLSVGERSFVANALSGADVSSPIIKLAREVATTEKINLDYAYRMVTDIMQGMPMQDYDTKAVARVEKKYGQEMYEIVSQMVLVESRREMMQAMALLLYRVDSNIGIEEVMTLHPDLLAELSALYRDEESKSVERLLAVEGTVREEVSEDIVAELEKK